MKVVDWPLHRLFAVMALLVKLLMKIAAPIQERRCDERQSQICRGPQGVASQNAESATLGGDRRLQPDLHRKIRDAVFVVRHRITFLSNLGPPRGCTCCSTLVRDDSNHHDSRSSPVFDPDVTLSCCGHRIPTSIRSFFGASQSHDL